MTTKYAKARDVAGQWKSELRKAQRENRSLRKVYAAARDLLDELAVHRLVTGTPLPSFTAEAASKLKSTLRNAIFAEPAATAIADTKGDDHG